MQAEDGTLIAMSSPILRRQTCAQCRARKVRCDGRINVCGNCERLGYECSFQSPQSPSSAFTPPRLLQNKGPRVSRACEACHRSKVRCSGHVEGCERCRSKGTVCVYSEQRPVRSTGQEQIDHDSHPLPSENSMNRQQQAFSPHSPSASDGGRSFGSIQMDPSASVQDDSMVRDRAASSLRKFFESLHCLPGLAFLHKASLMRLYREQKAEPALLAIIVALTSRLPGTSASEQEIGFRCADMAERLILHNVNNFKQPTFFNTQGLLLLLKFRNWTGEFNSAFIVMSQLSRAAFALRLNHESSKSSFFVQESRRRLMWAIYMLDVVLADGHQEFTTCPITAIHLRLPCFEDDFELDAENSSDGMQIQAQAPVRIGIMACYLRAVHLHDEVLRHVNQAANPRTSVHAHYAEFQRLVKGLDAFPGHLPQNERYSHRNLELRAYSPRLPRYIMTHVWWHECYCRLFRDIVLDPAHPATARMRQLTGEMGLQDCRVKCLSHAISVAEIFASFLELGTDGCVIDMEMAHCAYYAAEMLIHSAEHTRSLLNVSRDKTSELASVCLRLTRDMLPMYPAISQLVAELAAAVESLTLGQQPPLTCSSTALEIAQQPVSKHSALYQTSFTDDSHKLDVAEDATSSITQQETQLQQSDSHHSDTTTHDHVADRHDTGANQLDGWMPTMNASEAQEQSLDASAASIWDQMPLFQDGFEELDLGTGGAPVFGSTMPPSRGPGRLY